MTPNPDTPILDNFDRDDESILNPLVWNGPFSPSGAPLGVKNKKGTPYTYSISELANPGRFFIAGVSPIYQISATQTGSLIGAGTYSYTPPVPVTTYYLSPTGNDSNPGTIGSPFRTFSKANSMLGPGVRIYVRGGTYTEQVYISGSGSGAGLAQVIAYPGETPIIDGLDYGIVDYSALFKVTGNYVLVMGLEIKNSGRTTTSLPVDPVGYVYTQGVGFMLLGSNCIVDSINTHHNGGNGLLVAGSSSYSIVQNCLVWRNALANEIAAGHSVSYWAGGLNVARYPDNIIVRNNTVYDNWGEGMSVFEGTNVTFEHNICGNGYSTAVYISDCSYVTFDGNFVYRDPTSYLYMQTETGNNIMFGNEVRTTVPIDHVYIINNISYNGRRNLYFWLAGSSVFSDVLIAHNTFLNAYDPKDPVANIQINQANHVRTYFQNNIISQYGSALPNLINILSTNITYNHNCWNCVTKSSGTGDVNADPLLKKIGSAYSLPYYELQNGSPCFDAAIAVSPAVSRDIYSLSRGTPPTIGAME